MDVHEACVEFAGDMRFVPDLSWVVLKCTGLKVDGVGTLWTDETWVTGGMHTRAWVTRKAGEEREGCCIVERAHHKESDPSHLPRKRLEISKRLDIQAYPSCET